MLLYGNNAKATFSGRFCLYPPSPRLRTGKHSFACPVGVPSKLCAEVVATGAHAMCGPLKEYIGIAGSVVICKRHSKLDTVCAHAHEEHDDNKRKYCDDNKEQFQHRLQIISLKRTQKSPLWGRFCYTLFCSLRQDQDKPSIALTVNRTKSSISV